MLNSLAISGAHGVGKTSLVNVIIKNDSRFQIASRTRVEFSTATEPFQRCCIREAAYAVDMLAIKKSAFEKTHILDRCIFDSFAYATSFSTMGWITADQYSYYLSQLAAHTRMGLYPSHVAVLDLPFEETRNRLKRRSKVESERWRQESDVFLKTLLKTYKNLEDELRRQSLPCPKKLLVFNRNFELNDILDCLGIFSG